MTEKGLKLGFWGGPFGRKMGLLGGRLNELNALKAGHLENNRRCVRFQRCRAIDDTGHSSDPGKRAHAFWITVVELTPSN